MEKLKGKALFLLKNNINKGYSKNLNREYFYISPDKIHFHQWFWDSCFHTIVTSKLEPELAKKEFETLLSVQKEDGFLPHIIFWKLRFKDHLKRWWLEEVNRKETIFFSAEIQPPVIGISLLEIYKNTKDISFVKRNIEKVEKYYSYLRDKRDPDKDALVSIITPMESGMDLSPQYDVVFGNYIHNPIITRKKIKELLKNYKKWNWDLEKIFKISLFDVEDVSFNTIYCLGLFALCELYSLFNKSKEKELKEWSSLVKKSIIEKFWDKKEKLYFSLFHKEGKEFPMKVKTISSLFPLTLPIPKNHINHLIQHLKSEKEFWSKYPIPSVARDEPSFGPLTDTRFLWRGTTWINTNWFIIKGLQKHGYKKLSLEISKKTIELIKKFDFCEFYDPLDGHPGKAMKNFSWSTLVIELLN
ncbi:MAG: hypothetical protein ABIN61_04840 [candidate division WOR-3 bacterium]